MESRKHAFLDIPREPGLPRHTDRIPRMGCERGLYGSESRPRVLSPLEVGNSRTEGLRQGPGTETAEARRWDYVAVHPAARLWLGIRETESDSLRSPVEFWRRLESWHVVTDTHWTTAVTWNCAVVRVLRAKQGPRGVGVPM